MLTSRKPSTTRRLSYALAVTAAASLTLAAGSAGAHTLHRHTDGEHGGAVFVQNDNAAGNAIDVYDRAANGALTEAGTYATGGLGGQLQGSVVDHLASQNSLVYNAAAGELFAVNAGSDTVSVFGVHGDHLRLRQTVSSGGSFPSSITVHGDEVYVLNSLAGGSIQGYRLFGGALVPIPGSSRALGLNAAATPQFVNTPGDIAFTPNGRDLLVSTKANTNAIDVFRVGRGGLPAATPVVNTEAGDVPFAFAFSGHQVDVAQAGNNAVVSYNLQGDGSLQAIDTVATGGAATCWVVADGSELFASNAGSATETSVLASPTGGLTLNATTATDPGTVDAAPSPNGDYLYVQTGGNGIVDEYGVGATGALTEIGSVTIPGGYGEGIATS